MDKQNKAPSSPFKTAARSWLSKKVSKKTSAKPKAPTKKASKGPNKPKAKAAAKKKTSAKQTKKGTSKVTKKKTTQRKPGRPKAANPLERLSIRLKPQTIAYLKKLASANARAGSSADTEGAVARQVLELFHEEEKAKARAKTKAKARAAGRA